MGLDDPVNPRFTTSIGRRGPLRGWETQRIQDIFDVIIYDRFRSGAGRLVCLNDEAHCAAGQLKEFTKFLQSLLTKESALGLDAQGVLQHCDRNLLCDSI